MKFTWSTFGWLVVGVLLGAAAGFASCKSTEPLALAQYCVGFAAFGAVIALSFLSDP